MEDGLVEWRCWFEEGGRWRCIEVVVGVYDRVWFERVDGVVVLHVEGGENDFGRVYRQIIPCSLGY